MERLNWKPKNKLEKAGLDIVRLLNKHNFQAFIVGGFVRDLFTNKVSDNLDIATDAQPEEVEKILDSAKIHHKPFGKKFGTILALPKGIQVEITTFRREGRYSDLRHPDQVEFIREYLDDAKRRDFSINAMYFNPVSGELFDPVGGRKDLKAGMIRFVGDPKKRIEEDPLRMLRAIRFAATLGFKLEKNTFAAIKTRSKLIQSISGERIKQELDKILLSEQRSAGLRLMDSAGLLRFIIPELPKLKKIDHRSPRHHQEGNMYEHTLLALDLIKTEDLILVYAILFHDIGKMAVTMQKKLDSGGWEYFSTFGHEIQSEKIFKNFARRLRFSRKDTEMVSWLVLHHDDRINYQEMKERKRFKYSLAPDFERLITVWEIDTAANIQMGEDGNLYPGKSESVTLARKVLGIIKRNKKLVEKFSSGEFIKKETNLPQGIRVGEISDEIKLQILLGEIKNELDAKKFLKKFAKNT